MKHGVIDYRSRVWAWWRQLLVYSFRVRVEFNNRLLIAYFKGLSFIFTIIGSARKARRWVYFYLHIFFSWIECMMDIYVSFTLKASRSANSSHGRLGQDGVLVILSHTFCFRDLWFNLYSLQINLWVNMNRKLFIFSKQLVFWSVVDYGAYECKENESWCERKLDGRIDPSCRCSC